MIFTNTLDFTTHNLNVTFLDTLLSESSWFYHVEVCYCIISLQIHNFSITFLQTYVTWNRSSIPYVPPKHNYTCMESTLYPVPGLVEDVSITSCSSNDSGITLYLEWSPPSTVVGELDSYDIYVGVTLLPDQETPPDNGSHECSELNVCVFFKLNDYDLSIILL